MNRHQVPVTLPRARFDIDTDGHLAVTVDGQPWQPPTGDPTRPTLGTARLGRSDVLWAQQQVANDLDTPIRAETVDGGRSRTDIVLPDGYQVADPDGPQAPATADVGRYAPGEPVVISVVVDRVHADEHGHVDYRLPAALGTRTVLVHGETSGTTLPLNLAPLSQRATKTETPSRPSPSPSLRAQERGIGRRQSGSGHAPQPVRPVPRAARDDGLGSL